MFSSKYKYKSLSWVYWSFLLLWNANLRLSLNYRRKVTWTWYDTQNPVVDWYSVCQHSVLLLKHVSCCCCWFVCFLVGRRVSSRAWLLWLYPELKRKVNNGWIWNLYQTRNSPCCVSLINKMAWLHVKFENTILTEGISATCVTKSNEHIQLLCWVSTLWQCRQ